MVVHLILRETDFPQLFDSGSLTFLRILCKYFFYEIFHIDGRNTE